MNSIFMMIVFQIILIMLNAVFACAEIAVISMNDTKLSKLVSAGDKRAIRLTKLTARPAKFLATIQVAITLSGFLGSAFAAENFSGKIVNWLVGLGVKLDPGVLDTLAVVFITLILSYFTLVFGELVPKQVAMRKAEKIALGISGPIRGISVLFAPIVGLLTISTNGVLRLMGIDPNAVQEEAGEEEIRMMVDVGNEKGTIDDEERDFIENVFEFDNLTIEEIITHRTDVTMLDTNDSVEVWDSIINNTSYTYYPICDGTPDEIVGVLNTKLYFRLLDKSRESIMKNAVSPAYFVPETLKADTLFRNMKKEGEHFAVVLDEYGGVSGIVTIKNLIEELVGDLRENEVENGETETAIQIEESVWQADGGIMLDELSELVGKNFTSEEYDTLNGLIFHTLGEAPETGDEMEIPGALITVTEVQNHLVKTAILKLVDENEDDESENKEKEEV